MENWKAYEVLAQDLANRLSAHFGADTEQCDHNTKITGRGTTNQIDVVWIGTINGSRRRIVIECKHFNKPVAQGFIHTFVGVLYDIAEKGLPTIGVFVTPIGYQKGALNLAEANDLFILELREPSEADVEGRVLQIKLNIVLQSVVFADVEFDWVVTPAEVTWPCFLADLAWLYSDSGQKIPAQGVLAAELGPDLKSQFATAATATGNTSVRFQEPMSVEIDGQVVGTATGVTGRPHVQRQSTTTTVGPGRDGIAHLIKDGLDGTTVWFTDDGKIRVINS